tara:strand:- start:160 stop:759 length:600 start_codon:yes stop_codon:yes gene_type:complete
MAQLRTARCELTGARFEARPATAGRHAGQLPRYATPEGQEAANSLERWERALVAVSSAAPPTPEGARSLLGDVTHLRNVIKRSPEEDDPMCDRRRRSKRPKRSPVPPRTRARRDKWAKEGKDVITGVPHGIVRQGTRGRLPRYGSDATREYAQRYSQLLTAIDRLNEVCPWYRPWKASVVKRMDRVWQDTRNIRFRASF